MEAGAGVEPAQARMSLGYEPSMLPLHYPAIWLRSALLRVFTLQERLRKISSLLLVVSQLFRPV
jgi:hypothetical protein